MQMTLLALGAALSVLAAAPARGAGRDRQAAGPGHEARAGPEAGAADAGPALVGRPAPAWSFERWIGTAPLALESLRGKVVLVRWWTEGCHYCAATLPALETLRARHAGDGLVVIGAYHPKPPRGVSDRRILALAKRLGFTGPIAVDERWGTLVRWWLDGRADRSWTSVSFLIDRAGIIRWVHGGGEYHPSGDPRHAGCDLEYRGLEAALAASLAGPAARRSAAGTSDP